MPRSLCWMLLSLGVFWPSATTVGQESRSRGGEPSQPTSARTSPVTEPASAPPPASRHPALSQAWPAGSLVPRLVTPWAGSVAPVYPQWGGGRLYDSPHFPDYRAKEGDIQVAPLRSPRSLTPVTPKVPGSRTAAGAPPADLHTRATLLAPPTFYRPYYTAVNDPLQVQYGPGVQPFLPLTSPPRFPR